MIGRSTILAKRQNCRCATLPPFCVSPMEQNKRIVHHCSSSFSTILIILILITGSSNAQQRFSILTVPGHSELSKIDTGGISILPSGRYVTPAGKTIRITHDPFGLAISPDQETAISLHENVFTIIDLKENTTKRIPDYNKNAENPLKKDLNRANQIKSEKGNIKKSVTLFDIDYAMMSYLEDVAL